jgi:hypothetical protein
MRYTFASSSFLMPNIPSIENKIKTLSHEPEQNDDQKNEKDNHEQKADPGHDILPGL